jgi:hypothetical protein
MLTEYDKKGDCKSKLDNSCINSFEQLRCLSEN